MYFGKSAATEPIQDNTLELLKNCVISILEGSIPNKESKLRELDISDGLTISERIELSNFIKEQVTQKQRAILRTKASQFLVGEDTALDSLGTVVRNFGMMPQKTSNTGATTAQAQAQINPMYPIQNIYNDLLREYEQIHNGFEMQRQMIGRKIYGINNP